MKYFSELKQTDTATDLLKYKRNNKMNDTIMGKNPEKEQESRLIKHTRNELVLAKIDVKENPNLYNSVMELMHVFDKQDHSGASASMSTALFRELTKISKVCGASSSVGSFIDLVEKKVQELGFFDRDSDYAGMLGTAAMKLMKVFARQDHCEYVSKYVAELFIKLSMFNILTPLTDENVNWQDVDNGHYQSRRLSGVFKDEKGVMTCQNAIVWKSKPGGATFTGTVEGLTSHQQFHFPFVQKTFYINVEEDKESNYFIVDRDDLIAVNKYYQNVETPDFDIPVIQ